jgi:magnesium transporter
MLSNTIGIRASIDSSRDLLDGVNEGIHAQSARQTEQVMRVLTILSASFMPLTLITGIYGMNFHNMPELNWQFGYFITLGFMGCILTGFLTLFYKKGWMPSWKKRTR